MYPQMTQMKCGKREVRRQEPEFRMRCRSSQNILHRHVQIVQNDLEARKVENEKSGQPVEAVRAVRIVRCCPWSGCRGRENGTDRTDGKWKNSMPGDCLPRLREVEWPSKMGQERSHDTEARIQNGRREIRILAQVLCSTAIQ